MISWPMHKGSESFIALDLDWGDGPILTMATIDVILAQVWLLSWWPAFINTSQCQSYIFNGL